MDPLSVVSSMLLLREQCKAAKSYPKNVALQGYPKYQIDLRYGRLQEEGRRLFYDQESEKRSILLNEFSEGGESFFPLLISTLSDLQVHLGLNPPRMRRDPWCRYVFLMAHSSRDRLNTTHDMFMLCCTYLQVMPEFLDLLLMFGKQSRPRHFHQSSFYHRTRLNQNTFKRASKGLEIPGLGWSGQEFQLCYNLKSVERSSQGHWPWSIRDCAVHHSFDVQYVRIVWIFIKGDTLLQDRIGSATGDSHVPEMASFNSLKEAFVSTLMTHRLICEWVPENVDDYILFIEDELQQASSGVILNNVDSRPYNIRRSRPISGSFQQRLETDLSSKSRFSTFTRTGSRVMDMQKSSGLREKQGINFNPRGEPDESTSRVFDEPMGVDFDSRGQKEFSFSDLQRLQFLRDKLNEIILVLDLDVDQFSQLLDFYEQILRNNTFRKAIENTVEELLEFRSMIMTHTQHLQACKRRLQTLLEKLTDNMRLLYGIMEYESTQSSKILASHSSASNSNMEAMTLEMNDLARQTKAETVSMKVITLVTLAFLPGTFVSTLMSTDIFQRNDSNPTSPNPYKDLTPLQIYLALTLPMTVVTLSIWAIFNYREKATAEFRRMKHYAQQNL